MGVAKPLTGRPRALRQPENPKSIFVTDIILEIIRTLVLFGILCFLLASGYAQAIKNHRGWKLIITGFCLLLFGSILDMTDNYESLNRYVVIGETEVQAFLVKFVGNLGGYVFLAFGFLKLLPSIRGVTDLVERHGNDLQEANEKLAREATEREKAVLELRQNEKRFRTISSLSPAGIFQTDKDGKVTYVNGKWCVIAGMDYEEALGDGWLSALEPESRADSYRHWQEYLDRGDVYYNEQTYIRKDGRETACLSQVMPERDINGDIIGHIGCITDITDLKNAERKLQKVNEELETRVRERTRELDNSQSRLRSAIDMADIGFYTWDSLEDRCKFCSDKYAEMHGVIAKEFVANASRLDGDFSYTHPEDREKYRSACTDLRNGKGFNIEYRIVTPSGETRWLHEIGKPIFDTYGNVIEEQIVGREITNQKLAEIKLKENAAAFEQAEKIALIHNWISDRSLDHWIKTSENVERILGVPSGELLGDHSSFYFYVHPEDQERLKKAYKTASNNAAPYRVEYRFCRPDGKVIHLREIGEPTFDKQGEIKNFQGTTQDISDLKLAEAQLLQTSKLASLGEMATGIAHELNQPLNTIQMSTDLLEDLVECGDLSTQAIKEKTTLISEQILRASSIINHMRTFGREVAEESSPISILDTIKNSVLFTQEQLRVKNIEIRHNLPDTCRPVMGNMIQLEQVILNLLSNSRHAIEANRKTDGEKGYIDISLVEAPAADEIHIIVSDTGGGIPEGIIERIFDPFFTTKEIGQGTGVGLSVSYGIITEMGGTINVESNPEGSSFTIALPTVKYPVIPMTKAV